MATACAMDLCRAYISAITNIVPLSFNAFKSLWLSTFTFLTSLHLSSTQTIEFLYQEFFCQLCF